MDTAFLVTLMSALLVFCRVGAFAMSAPPLSAAGVPLRVRIALGVGITVALAPTIAVTPLVLQAVLHDSSALALAVIREVVLGLSLGLALTTIFSAARMAGEMVGVEIGFTLSNVVDPQSGKSVGELAQLYDVVSWLLFFAVNGHHFVIGAIAGSFRGIPLGSFTLRAQAAESLVNLVRTAVESAILIAFPLLIVLFACTVVVILLARAVPQLHLMDFGYPARVVVALGALSVILPRSAPAFLSVFRFAESWLAGAVGGR
ncbi:MAG: flagellar biosynthetic protein FliR [Planctomycetes bacterium]|nr:flagellar biosynthetic protein FliR [Planctomycetota bacterium]MBI3843056.1 flagellar biosynthetic protein FliR [Planctomycetota bacterium]